MTVVPIAPPSVSNCITAASSVPPTRPALHRAGRERGRVQMVRHALNGTDEPGGRTPTLTSLSSISRTLDRLMPIVKQNLVYTDRP